MAKRQSEPSRPGEPAPAPAPARRPADPIGISTLVGVAAVLMVSIVSWRAADVAERNLSERLGRLEARLEAVANRPAAAAPQRGPDPSRVYAINTANSPFRGSASAPVTIAEFSDFQ